MVFDTPLVPTTLVILVAVLIYQYFVGFKRTLTTCIRVIGLKPSENTQYHPWFNPDILLFLFIYLPLQVGETFHSLGIKNPGRLLLKTMAGLFMTSYVTWALNRHWSVSREQIN